MGFVLVFGLMAASLIALMANDGQQILGLYPDQFAQATMAAAVAVGLTGSLAGRFRGRFGEALRALAVWSLIFVGFAGIYAYRFELEGVAERILGELMPGRVTASAPGVVSVARRRDGHYVLDAQANGASMRFMFDTGASSVVLRSEDARRLGVDVDRLTYDAPVSTANGMTKAAQIKLATLAVGGIV